MIQEINRNVSVIWENIDPSAMLVEKYGERISMSQQGDVIDISKQQAKDLIKVLRQKVK